MKKKCAIGYLRFNKNDSIEFKNAMQNQLIFALSKEGFKIIAFIIDIKPNCLKVRDLVSSLKEPRFLAAKYVITYRREMFKDSDIYA